MSKYNSTQNNVLVCLDKHTKRIANYYLNEAT